MAQQQNTRNVPKPTPKPEKQGKPEKVKLTKEQKQAARAAAEAKLINFRTAPATPSEILNPDGLLTTSTPQANGYNAEIHKELGREDFANEGLWLNFRADEVEARGKALLAKADELRTEAKTAVTLGDPSKRAAHKKLAKMVGAMAELSEVLAGEGIDVEALLKAARAKAQAAKAATPAS